MPPTRAVRVGAVNYLNTRPLIYGLQRLAPRAELVLDLPSRLADGLADGRYDVALVPIIEFFRDPTYALACDACIACRGPVLSVKLFFRVPPPRVRTLALDEGSRTSAALARVLLREKCGVEPRCATLPIGAGLDDASADAVLLIGDRAIHSPPRPFAAVWDLGDEWVRWTGLPFVFAVWAAHPGTDLDGIDAALAQARDDGVAHLDEIAASEAAALGLTRPECLAYLRDNLHFHLGSDERRGAERFRELADGLGPVPSGADVGLLAGKTA